MEFELSIDTDQVHSISSSKEKKGSFKVLYLSLTCQTENFTLQFNRVLNESDSYKLPECGTLSLIPLWYMRDMNEAFAKGQIFFFLQTQEVSVCSTKQN